ncbi:glycosyltransferase family 1 protein [Marinoscillum sp. MHG1-6]|uniref:glycosyltransferase family 4 protein n=1 Tax=Marinoscillum sp. MHG1-6 TaxID=2959627 RepID=UPI0021571CC8|nr:glycosyltransferase family 1 protein [Marinoscillum sp. MHG1-6]
MKRNILIDAKWLFSGPISGKVVLEAYLSNLINYIDEENEIELLLDSRDRENGLRYSALGFKVSYIWARINLLSNLFLTFRLKSRAYDVLLLHNFGPFLSRVNYVLFIHDVLFDDFPEYFSWIERVYFKFIKPSAKNANGIITISETEKQRLIRNGYGGAAKVKVLYNGVDLGRFGQIDNFNYQDVKAKYGILKNYLLYYGRLNDRKNILGLINGTRDFCKSKDTQLVIAGQKDSLYSELKAVDTQHVSFIGYVPDDQLGVLIREAMAFCYLSFAEGFGLPPLEAMALGTPTVVSRIPVFEELFETASIFVDPNSLESIEDGLELLDSEGVKENLITEGLRVADKFSWGRSSENLFKILIEATI